MVKLIQSLLGLLRLFLLCKGRINNSYWAWRKETAFGKKHNKINFLKKLNAILAFGAWSWRMTRLKSKNKSNLTLFFLISYFLWDSSQFFLYANDDLNNSNLQQANTWQHGYADGYRIQKSDGTLGLCIDGILSTRAYSSKASKTLDQKKNKSELLFSMASIDIEFDDFENFLSLDARLDISKNNEKDKRAELKWGYISYDINRKTKINAGRFLSSNNKFSFTAPELQIGPDVPITAMMPSVDGVRIDWKDRNFELGLSLTRGISNEINNSNRSGNSKAFTLRSGVLLAGTRKSMADFLSDSKSPFGAYVGCSLHYESADLQTESKGSFVNWSIEGHLDFSGPLFSILYQKEQTAGLRKNGFNGSRPWGILVQTSYPLAENWNLYGQNQIFDYDIPGQPLLRLSTIGVSWKVDKSSKIHLDYSRASSPFIAFFDGARSNQGWRGQTVDGNDQSLLRLQWTYTF